MKKILLFLTLSIIIPSFAFAADECPVPTCTGQVQTEAKCCEVLDNLRKERHAMYNALYLNPDQLQCLLEIEKRVEFDLDSLFLRLCVEHGKLEQMQKEKVNRNQIKAQKEEIKCIGNEIDEIIKRCDKEFEAVLSCDQLAKYHMMKKLEKNDLKNCAKTKKVNPDLRIFGEKPVPRPIKPCRKLKIFSHVE